MNTTANNRADGSAWRVLASDSVVVTVLRRVAADAPVRDSITDASADEGALRLGASSRVVRAIARPGELIATAWPHSIAARARSTWLSMPLDTRVRLVAIMVAVAAVTHIALTRFRAPQPTATARVVWIGALILLASTAAWSRPIAAAWTDWRRRRTNTGEGETA